MKKINLVEESLLNLLPVAGIMTLRTLWFCKKFMGSF